MNRDELGPSKLVVVGATPAWKDKDGTTVAKVHGEYQTADGTVVCPAHFFVRTDGKGFDETAID